MPPAITTSRATGEDVDVILRNVQAGLDSYVEFAPPGWRAPQVAGDRERTRQALNDPETWAVLALVDGTTGGHVSFRPARQRVPSQDPHDDSERPLLPGLAHLWQLFVQPDWWGRGVAATLHEAAIEEMQARSYARARLFTPSHHMRARRFYERHGWTATREEWNPGLGLLLSEYRRGLG